MDKKRSINTGNKRILEIAIPSIISNITVPLLGLIDVTIVGHLGSAAYIGAIAIGGMLFNIIYWIFGKPTGNAIWTKLPAYCYDLSA